MPYLVASIIALVAAMIVLMTRFEADDSQITADVERAKSMFLAVDSYANTYIQSGGDLTQINFEKLFDDGILPGNITKGTDAKDNIQRDKGFASQLKFPNSNIIWQIVPIVSGDKVKDSTGTAKDISSSAGTGYKLFVDFSNQSSLKSKAGFSENFFGKEICEKNLFGSFINDATSIISAAGDTLNNLNLGGSSSDSKFACVVFK